MCIQQWAKKCQTVVTKATVMKALDSLQWKVDKDIEEGQGEQMPVQFNNATLGDSRRNGHVTQYCPRIVRCTVQSPSPFYCEDTRWMPFY